MKAYTAYKPEELLRLTSQGDPIAFTEIYNRYWETLFAIAYIRTKEIQTSEDIVHDIFTGLWANRKEIAIDRLENYLAVSVKYSVFAWVRKKITARKYLLASESSEVAGAVAESALHYKRILEIVNNEVENLPEKCKLVFRYSRQEGLPVKAIAEKLHLSPKTVENQLTRALKHLKLVTRSIIHSIFL